MASGAELGGGGSGSSMGALGMIGSIGGSLINGGFQMWQNDRNRKNQQDQYNTERDDALKDRAHQEAYNMDMWNVQNAYNQQMWNQQNTYNKGLWDMQNQYNSPAAQMQRFKDAGLNPNLIYGQMNNGPTIDASQMAHASAPNAPETRSAGSNANPGTPPHFDLANGILTMLGIQKQRAEIDNIKIQNENLAVDKALKVLDVTGKGLQNTLASRGLDYNVDALRLGVNKQKQELQFAANNEVRNQGAFELEQKFKKWQLQADQQKLPYTLSDLEATIKQRAAQTLLTNMESGTYDLKNFRAKNISEKEGLDKIPWGTLLNFFH